MDLAKPSALALLEVEPVAQQFATRAVDCGKPKYSFTRRYHRVHVDWKHAPAYRRARIHEVSFLYRNSQWLVAHYAGWKHASIQLRSVQVKQPEVVEYA